MIEFPKKKNEITIDLIVKTFSRSTILALIFTLPSLAVFLGIYYTTDNLLVSVVIGFGIHFVTLIFSGRISKFLTKVMG